MKYPARMRLACTAGLFLAALHKPVAFAQELDRYVTHVFFDNSVAAGFAPNSNGHASSPSTLKLMEGRLPLETNEFISGPNALELTWRSAPGGGWDAQLNALHWRNADLVWKGSNLTFWVWSPQELSSSELPRISFTDGDDGHTAPLTLGSYIRTIPARRWTRVQMPLTSLPYASLRPFHPSRLASLIFSQDAADNKPHTLFIDEIRIGDVDASTAVPATPASLSAKGFERHIDLQWEAPADAATTEYVIYRSMRGGPYKPIGVQRYGVHRYTDYVGGNANVEASYQVSARGSSLRESARTGSVTAHTHPMSDDDLLSMVQEASFRYYWDGAEPVSGMTLESQPGPDDLVATGASGFGVMALVVAVDRGFITREQGLERLNRIATFLEHADRYHGVWPHFLNGRTGRTVSVFGIYDDGADLVETAFMMQGLLTARQYFNADNPAESALRDRINALWRGVEWDWFRAVPKKDALYWHWSPNYAFHIANRLEGWNEVMITYLLAIASPTHPVPPSLYATGYTREGVGTPYGIQHTYFDIPLTQGYVPGSPGPLFFTQYSYLGYDPRGMHDKYSNYFRNNVNEARVSQAYAIANPKHYAGYGANSWGLTAVDGPDGRYHEYKPFEEDDGTIAPTGAIASYAYTPQASMLALKHWYRDMGAQLWSIYGFRDAFNQQLNWYSSLTMGLNQAPQVVMIENGRSGLIWKTFMSSPEIAPMQKAIGLVPDRD